LIFAALFSLEDPLRPGVHTSVLYNKKGEINVRLISGDNKETAKAVAIKAGIVTEAEAENRHVVMASEEFRNAIGEVRKTIDSEGNEKLIFSNK
jgi:P-type E1-E2 ATPase